MDDNDEHTLLALLAHVLLQNARPEKAATLLEALAVLDPEQPRTLRALAVAHIRSDKPDRALETLDHLAMTGAVDASFHLLRAQALHALGRRDEAATSMQSFLALRAVAPTANDSTT